MLFNKKIVLSLLLFCARKKTIVTMKKNASNVPDVRSDQMHVSIDLHLIFLPFSADILDDKSGDLEEYEYRAPYYIILMVF